LSDQPLNYESHRLPWRRDHVPLDTFPAAARFASQDNAVDTALTEMMVNASTRQPTAGGLGRRRHSAKG